MFALDIELTFQKIQKNRYRLESVSVKIGKMYRIGIGIGMLFFLNKKIGIGIGMLFNFENRYRYR